MDCHDQPGGRWCNVTLWCWNLTDWTRSGSSRKTINRPKLPEYGCSRLRGKTIPSVLTWRKYLKTFQVLSKETFEIFRMSIMNKHHCLIFFSHSDVTRHDQCLNSTPFGEMDHKKQLSCSFWGKWTAYWQWLGWEFKVRGPFLQAHVPPWRELNAFGRPIANICDHKLWQTQYTHLVWWNTPWSD